MKKCALVFCVRANQVLLAKKKGGIGIGRYNGFGGKLEIGETFREAAVRELEEEAGLIASPNDLQMAGWLTLCFDGVPKFECRIFLLDKWQGRPRESTENELPVWFPFSLMPYHEMLAADARWIPKVLIGRRIRAKIDFRDDDAVLEDFFC